MKKPFSVTSEYLRQNLEEMVESVISDLTSEFLVLPKGKSFLEYQHFQRAYECLKRKTQSFSDFTEEAVMLALAQNSTAFCVLRAILGMSPPEWSELAREELGSDVTQNMARAFDRSCRADIAYIAHLLEDREGSKTLERVKSMVLVAVSYITQGANSSADGVLHRLEKFDTLHGLASLRYASEENVPYAVLLYERYLGRPLATHRDAISELIGSVMEDAVEEQLRKAKITYRKTQRAERIPGFGQAPDFCIPDEISPIVVIEAKIASDDGTARDKVTRIENLKNQRDAHVRAGGSWYEVVACIDGRGFRHRREDMRKMLIALDGKVFTTATLSQLVANTQLHMLAIPDFK